MLAVKASRHRKTDERCGGMDFPTGDPISTGSTGAVCTRSSTSGMRVCQRLDLRHVTHVLG